MLLTLHALPVVQSEHAVTPASVAVLLQKYDGGAMAACAGGANVAKDINKAVVANSMAPEKYRNPKGCRVLL